MDPIATLTLYLEQRQDGDPEAEHTLRDLVQWCRKGGFLPDGVPAEVRILVTRW